MGMPPDHNEVSDGHKEDDSIKGELGEVIREFGHVFERRTSTRSGLFFSVLDNGFAQIFGQIVSMIVKTLRSTNFAASSCFKMKKTSLPVNVRRSKTPLFKLSIVPYKYVRRIFLTASLLSGRIHEAIS